MEALTKTTPGLSMGPTSPYINEAKRFIANFFPGISQESIAAADSLEKINRLLASESTKMFTPRGTNFDLQTFMNANPSLSQSREGMLMMIDLLKQEMKQTQELGSVANKYRNKDVSSWNDRKQEYYDDHPLIIHKPIGGGKYQDITTKRIDTKEERDALKPGTNYIRPDGTIGTRP
jgi:hypothetical protein